MDRMKLDSRLLCAKMKMPLSLPVFCTSINDYLRTLSEMTGEKRFATQYLAVLLQKIHNTSHEMIVERLERLDQKEDIEEFDLSEIIYIFSGADYDNIQLVMKILIEPFAVLNERRRLF